jgi:hypothetical protein
MPPAFQHLHNRSVALELVVQQELRVLKGVAFYEAQERGSQLRIVVSDPAGDFEILLEESQWTGQIDAGQRYECDFALRLNAESICRR